MTTCLDKYKNVLGFSVFIQILFRGSATTCSQEELAYFLEAVGVQNSIGSFLHVVENFCRYAAYVPGICYDESWLFVTDDIASLHYTASSIRSERDRLSRIHILTPPLTRKINNALRGNTSDSPLYVTLGYLPDSRQHMSRYDQLCAQVNISLRAQILKKRDPEKGGAKLSAVLGHIRSLAKKDAPLSDFPQDVLSPEDYVSRLRALAPTPMIQEIAEFVAQGVSCLPSDPLKKVLDQLNGGTQRTRPFLLRGDAGSDDSELVRYLEEEEQPGNDESPAINGRFYLLHVNPSSRLSRSRAIYLGRQVAASRAMGNQLLETAWDQLNQHDIKMLLDYLFSTARKNQEDDATRAQLALMLFAGLPARRLSRLEVSYDGEYTAKTDCYFVESKKLRLVSPGPKLTGAPAKEADDHRYQPQCFIDLDLPDPVVQLISRNLTNDRLVRNGPLFDDDHFINSGILSVFSRLRSNAMTRLTLKRVQNYLPGVLSRMPGGDIAVSSLVLGEEFYLARTRIHYASFDSAELKSLHRGACQHILKQGGYSHQLKERYPFDEGCVGTPFRPKREAIQKLVADVRGRLDAAVKRFPTIEALAVYHNCFTLYTWLYLAYNTGYRAVNAPGIREEYIDSFSGLSVVRDKDSPDHYHTRLVWLSKGCRAQLRHYHLHASQLLSKADWQENLAERAVLFFMDPETGSISAATRSRIEQELQRYGFYLPVNCQRHFLKSELQEDGCDPDAIELMLGHWSLGQEGWCATSGLHPMDFGKELETYLEPLLRRLGFFPIGGLVSAPKNFCLPTPIHSPRSTRNNRRTDRPLSLKMLRPLFSDSPAKIWFDCLGKLFQDLPVERAFRSQQQIVLLRLKALLPELYDGKRDVQVDDQLCDQLYKKLTSKVKQPQLIYKRMAFLVKGLETGKKELGWNVVIPNMPIVLPREKNRIRQPVMALLPHYREVEKIFLKDLEQPCANDPILQAGQVLLSAILYGGLNHERWVRAFIDGLFQRWVYQWNGIVWVDLWAVPRPEISSEQWLMQREGDCYRRWLADPLTQLLLDRLLRTMQECLLILGFDVDSIYRECQRRLFVASGFKLPALKILLKWGNAWMTLNQPGFLSAYSENQVSSSSLPDPVWMRLLTGQHYPSVVKARSSYTRLKSQSYESLAETQKSLIRALRMEIIQPSLDLEKKTIPRIQDFVQKHREELCPVAWLMSQWAIQLLRKQVSELEHRKGPPEAPRTVYTYLGCIYSDLLDMTGDCDITSLDPEELEALVGQWIEKSRYCKTDTEEINIFTQRRMDYFVARLNQFLGFVHYFHDAELVNVALDGVAAQVRRGSGVRANLMTVGEYRRLLSVMGFTVSGLRRTERIALIWVILAFRAGLRVSEINGLRIGDLQCSEKFEVLVQPYAHHKLKTASSCRRIPLYALLPEDELNFIRQWHGYRLKEPGATLKCPLFTDAPLVFVPLRREDVMGIVSPAIKQVTGDAGMVFHSLRHSFSTWMMIRLQQPETFSLRKLPHFLDDAEFLPQACGALKRELLPNATANKKGLFLTAGLLGHADTVTELSSYIHCCDWLSWCHLRRPSCMPALSASVVASLTGCSVANAYKILGKNKDHALASYLYQNPIECPAHPLQGNAIDVEAFNPPPTQKRSPDFIELLASSGNALSLKKHSHILMMDYWYKRLISRQSLSLISSGAQAVLDSYRAHYKLFFFTCTAQACLAADLLQNLGATLHFQVARYRGAQGGHKPLTWSTALSRKVYCDFGAVKPTRRAALRMRILTFQVGEEEDVKPDTLSLGLLLTLMTILRRSCAHQQ